MFLIILRRLAESLLTILAIVSVSFFMMKYAPGGPFDSEKNPPEAIRKAIEARYHLDESLFSQYLRYMRGLLELDLGPSFQVAHLSVNEVLAEGMGYTLRIGLWTMLLSVVVGVIIGMMAAWYRNRLADHVLMSLAMTGISIPSMVLAPVLLLLFGVTWNLLPTSGLHGTASYILPVFCLSLFYIANIARLTRGSMLEVLSSNYIRTARAKGLSTRAILFGHALRPAMIPVLSYLGPAMAGMLAGSLVIEKIFVIPGVGRQFVDSAFARDYTMALGMIIFYCVMVVFFNAIVDIIYRVLDPQI